MSKFTAAVFMPSGYLALLYTVFSELLKKACVVVLLLLAGSLMSQNGNEDIKKQADKLFKEDNFTEAYKYYSQLVANYPKDPEYNYRLGVCMIYSEPDKKKCLPYLKLAASNPNDAPKEASFYLAKAYHINYRFDDAIKNYIEFKKTASSSQLKKLQVDREITACNNGKQLLSNLTDLVIMGKKELNEADYFRSYDTKKLGKLLVKPDEFKSSADKKKKEKSVVFLPNGGDVVFYSSYGNDGATGKDIYFATRNASGFSAPQKVPGINTEFDEDYPFLHPDGKSLYFASKGYNSMGGYDIFKSTYNESSQSWGPPQNMEFPINSPDDDYLFVTDSLETVAYFSTGRQSPPGKIDVLKVKTERRPIDILAVKGTVKKGQVDHSLASVISVKELFGDREIGTFSADEEGNYELELPNAGKLVFTVETPGMETQQAQVTMPAADKLKPLKQSISYENGKLKILNYFDEAATDNSYLDYMNVIEKKAKLDVNSTEDGQPLEPSPLAASTPASTPQVQPQEPGTAPATNGNINNQELAALARKDAVESKQEAAQLAQDSKDAIEAGNKLKADAVKRIEEADEAITSAEAITDETERKNAVDKATDQKIAAEADQAVAEKMLAFGKSLSEDAETKEKEASLNETYATELEKAITSKNATQLQQVADLQKEIQQISSQQKESESMLTEIKSGVDEKEKELSNLQKENADLKTSIEETKTTISGKETELSNAKKKKEKKQLEEDLTGLKTELQGKETEYTANESKIAKLNEDIDRGKNELSMATRIKEESKKIPLTTPPEKLNNRDLGMIYKDRIVVADPNDKNSVQKSINELNYYNKDIEAAVSLHKTQLAAAKSPAEKQKINTELKDLENTRKKNMNLISNNFNLITQITKREEKEKVPVENNTAFKTLKADNPEEATALLNELDTELKEDESELFSINYRNPSAVAAKDEANTKLGESIEKQKKILEEIGNAREQLKSVQTNTSPPVVTADQLYGEADALTTKAQDLRSKAKGAQGRERDDLIAEAKSLEEKAIDKNLEASGVTMKDNTSTIATNQENIQNLLKVGAANSDDQKTAKQLSDDAVIAFRKAVEIRNEANSLTNKGSKLGSFSNAEDQEAEAILKQQQAIDLLMKSSPTYELKPIITSTTLAKAESEKPKGPAVEDILSKINTSMNELSEVKIGSYEKLYDANAAEIGELAAGVNAKQDIADKNPAIKTDLLSAKKALAESEKLKSKASRSTDPNEKYNLTITAVKQQNLALQKMEEVNQAILKAEKATPPVAVEIVTGPPTTPSTTVVEPPTVAPVTTTETPVSNPEPVVTTPTQAPEPVVTKSAEELRLVPVAEVAQSDTTASDIINLLDDNSPKMQNAEAATIVQASLSRLKDLEALNREVSDELKKTEDQNKANAVANPADLRKSADSLLTAADDMASEAEDARSEADGAKGDTRKVLIAEAKDLEAKSQKMMFSSADMIRKANETEYKTNDAAITELVARLKNDDPDMAADIEKQVGSLDPLKTNIGRLRSDAESQTNPAAKLGGYGNAEEKESELIQKQNLILINLKKKYPEYVVKPLDAPAVVSNTAALEKQNALRDDECTQLINLINAFSLEYESTKALVPQNLSADDQLIKQNADELNSESKKLLIASASMTEHNEKIKTLSSSAKYGSTALDQLNRLVKAKPVAAVTTTQPPKPEIPGNPPAANNNPVSSPPPSAKPTKGVEVKTVNAYSNAKPIPIDAPMESGLIFRVQIGAFKTQIPNNAFRGLSPLNGERTPNGYIRYTAGNFNKIEGATAVKNDLRGLGYNDAFVVAYLNGKRITIGEALGMMTQQGIGVDPNAPQTAGITANKNVPKAVNNVSLQEMVSVTKELERINGLLFTIQIGVFNRQVTKTQLAGLKPIYSEELSSGLFRYTAGIYNNTEKLIADKNRVVELGLRDAFVSAYINGKRVPFAEAKSRQESDSSIKMEAESPIIFPSVTAVPASAPAAVSAPASGNEAPVKPFTNNVSSYPEATEENGIKANEEGVCYKVQIGAFSKEVPADVAAKFNSIRSWPVEHKQVNNLYIYNVGNFNAARFAKALRDQLKSQGINDAFITVYRDGKKLSGAEAESLLR